MNEIHIYIVHANNREVQPCSWLHNSLLVNSSSSLATNLSVVAHNHNTPCDFLWLLFLLTPIVWFYFFHNFISLYALHTLSSYVLTINFIYIYPIVIAIFKPFFVLVHSVLMILFGFRQYGGFCYWCEIILGDIGTFSWWCGIICGVGLNGCCLYGCISFTCLFHFY